MNIAESNSINLVEGGIGTYKVDFDLNDSNTILHSSTMILVTQNDKCLYLVKKSRTAPQHSSLYVLPLDKINNVTITSVSAFSNFDEKYAIDINLTRIAASLKKITTG